MHEINFAKGRMNMISCDVICDMIANVSGICVCVCARKMSVGSGSLLFNGTAVVLLLVTYGPIMYTRFHCSSSICSSILMYKLFSVVFNDSTDFNCKRGSLHLFLPPNELTKYGWLIFGVIVDIYSIRFTSPQFAQNLFIFHYLNRRNWKSNVFGNSMSFEMK